MLRFFSCLVLLLLCVSAEARPRVAVPRVAVWNPEQGTTSSRFQIDLEWLNQVALWLVEDGMETSRLATEQIEDAAQFSAMKFDALILPGDAFPRSNSVALQKFASDGGILISLGAGPVPFLTAIEKQGDTWTPSPVAPDKAWETSEIYHKVLGLVYNDVPAKRNEGVRHEATALFKKYLPENVTLPVIEKKLPSRWLVPRVGASLYPLIRSKRADGLETVPQLFITQNKTMAGAQAGAQDGKQTGLIAVSDVFTRLHEEKVWPLAKETILALAVMAADLKSGALTLTPDAKITLLDETPGDEE